jgi:large subunit ribosomal protein L21
LTEVEIVYAIVKIGGFQFRATPNGVLRVPKINMDVGGEVTINDVLLFSNGENIEVGQPFVEGKSLQAEVVAHGRDKKIVVFKKKRRKKYRRKNGHRQDFTEIRVKDFS